MKTEPADLGELRGVPACDWPGAGGPGQVGPGQQPHLHHPRHIRGHSQDQRPGQTDETQRENQRFFKLCCGDGVSHMINFFLCVAYNQLIKSALFRK